MVISLKLKYETHIDFWPVNTRYMQINMQWTIKVIQVSQWLRNAVLMITAILWGMVLVCFHLVLAALCSVAFSQGNEENNEIISSISFFLLDESTLSQWQSEAPTYKLQKVRPKIHRCSKTCLSRSSCFPRAHQIDIYILKWHSMRRASWFPGKGSLADDWDIKHWIKHSNKGQILPFWEDKVVNTYLWVGQE